MCLFAVTRCVLKQRRVECDYGDDNDDDQNKDETAHRTVNHGPASPSSSEGMGEPEMTL